MPNIITMSGPYGPILALMCILVLFLTVRTTLVLLGPKGAHDPGLKERLNSILFWGGVAAILGFLGQCSGTHQALSEILAASEISSQVVAQGFVISFLPTLFGLGIMAFSVAAWACLKLLALGKPRGAVSTVPGLFLLLAFTGCGAQESPTSLTDGAWVMEAGQDTFLWDFQQSSNGITCLVHNLQGPVKLNETPCQTVEVDGNSVQVTMNTGVSLIGEFGLIEGTFTGQLMYPDGGQREIELPWMPLHRFPTLAARGETTEPYRYRVPEGTQGDWEVGSASEAGVSPEALEAVVAAVERGEMGVLHSLLVARHGRLVLEEYFHGYEARDLHHLASCTKTVSSLLVGLAIQDGFIPGADTPLLSFFPEARDSHGTGWETLTLEHLLTMSMALDWTPDEVQSLHGTGKEFFKRVISRSVAGTPGEDFEYASANTNLIAGILHEATGEHAEAFARRTLFEPLGIESWNWDMMRSDGYNLMDGSLRLLPRDMAKIGQMALDGGRWQGRQVVHEEWIRASTTRKLNTGTGPEGYGYLWWMMETPGSDGERVPAFFANGWGSQFIMVLPTLDLVVVTTGGNEYNGMHMSAAGAISSLLLPGVQSEGS